MTEIQIPFHKHFIEASFDQLSPRLQAAVELIQISEERLTLEGDSLYETSGELNDYAKNIVEELSKIIERTAVGDVETVDLQMPLETAAEEISLIITTARGGENQNDSEYRKAKLAHQLSKCMAKQFSEYLLEILCEQISKGHLPPKRNGGCCTDRKVMVFTSTLAVLCAMLGFHAVDLHWPNLKSGKILELRSSELVDGICHSFYIQCTPPEEEVSDLSNLQKMTAFIGSCTRDYSLSTAQSEKLMASGDISRVIVNFSMCLKRFSVRGDLFEVPFTVTVKEIARLFAFDQNYTDGTWRAHCSLMAECISIGVLRTELKLRSRVEGERPSIEPKFEREEMVEGEVVWEHVTRNTRPGIDTAGGKLPTNIEQFHIEEEMEFNRKGRMYADKIYHDVFYCTSSLYKTREVCLQTPLLRLLNFLRVDLDRHLKENEQKPPSQLFGIDLTEELLTKLNGLKKSLELPQGDCIDYIHVLKALYALDKMFFKGTTSSILRGSLPKELELYHRP